MRRQLNLSGDVAHAGLPTAEDYSPELIGTAELQAGEPDQTWPEYGLELVPVMMDGDDTGRRLLRRNGKYLADVSDNYKLLPNEHLVGVANEVAEELGAVPFHDFDGDWFVKLDDHVFQDAEGRRVHALYALESGTVGDSGMEYGFAVHNSIDGSMGMSVGLFSFRHACANMVLMTTSTSKGRSARRVEGARQVLNRSTHRHTSGLDVDPEALAATIKSTIALVDDVDASYKRWVAEKFTPEQLADLIQRPQIAVKDLPEWAQDAVDAIDAVHEDEYDDDEEVPWARQAEIISAEMPEATTVWDTYNDLTAAIWHDGSSQDTTRIAKFRDLHRVLNPISVE